jgi:hypothetical protein
MCGFISDAVDWVSESISDVGDWVGETVSDVGDIIGDTVQNIIDDPLPTLVNVGLMAFGVPPVFAGMAAGATSAATNGGDILQGALTGGAMGYVGGAAAGGAASAGLSKVAQGAIGGAASGATGAVLTGGDIVQSALGGGLGGAASAALGSVVTDKFGNPIDSLKQSLGMSSPNNPAVPIVERGTINGVPVSGPVSPYDLSSGTSSGTLGTGLKMNNTGVGLQSGGQNISTGSIGNSLYGVTGVLPTGTSGSKFDLVSSTGTGGQGLNIDAKGQGLQATGGTGLQVGGNTGVQPLSPLPPVTNAGDLYGLSANQVSALDGSTTTPGGVPLIPLIAPVGKTKTTPGVGTFKFGDVTPLMIPDAVNPGFIKPTAYYNTTDPTQSRYYWGAHDYQTGDTFNPNQYNIVEGAPTEAWGNQPAPFSNQGINLVNPYAPVSTEGMQRTNPTPLMPQSPVNPQPVQQTMNVPEAQPYIMPPVAQPEAQPMISNVNPDMMTEPTFMSQPMTMEAQPMTQPISQPMQQAQEDYSYEMPTSYDQYYNMYTQAMGTEPINPADIQDSYNQYVAQNPTMFTQVQPA